MMESTPGVALSPVHKAQLHASGLDQGDARLDWVGKRPSQIGGPGSAMRAMASAVHGAIRDSAQIYGNGSSRLRLVDFPLNVFSALRNDPDALTAVLDKRNETINSVLKTWAESIKHNAEQDEMANDRRLKQGESGQRPGHQQRLFVGTLGKLLSAGITRPAAADLAEKAGIERHKTFFGPGIAVENSAKAMNPLARERMPGVFKIA